MLLVILLAIIIALLMIFMISIAAIGGATFIIVFGDVLVAILVLGYIIRLVIKKRKGK